MKRFKLFDIPKEQMPIYRRIYENLIRAEYFSIDRLKRIQLAELSRLLEHARLHVPFYKNRLPATITCIEDYTGNTPILSRQEYQNNIDFCIAQSMPPGIVNAGPIFTSGSSGIPVKIFQTNATQEWYKALNLRDLQWNGLDPKQSLAAIIFFDKSDDAWHGVSRNYWDRWIAESTECGPSYGLSIERDPDNQVEWLKKINPDYLVSYPSNLELLSDYLTNFSDLKLTTIKSLSEPLPNSLRDKIQTRFTIKDMYTCRESGYLASECEKGSLHVHCENIILEIVDENMRPCPPGKTGQVLLTTLHNYLSPLFRYAVGDYASFGAPCDCGRQHPVIERIDGKIHPPFKIAGNRYKNSIHIHSSLRKIGGCRQFQVIQKSDRFVVNIVPDKEWHYSLKSQIQEMLEAFFEGPVDVKVNLVDRIPLHKGKLRHLVIEQ